MSITACIPDEPTRAAAVSALRSPASVTLADQAERSPDSNPSAKITSGMGVAVGEAVVVAVTVIGVGVFGGVDVGVRVAVSVGVAVGVNVSVNVGVIVGGAVCASYEPISQCAPCGRVTPFCEVLFTGAAVQTVSSPASIAREPLLSEKYAGEPVSVPRLGSEPIMLPLTPLAKPQALLPVDSIRLLLSVTVPELFRQSPPLTLLARMVLYRFSVPPLFMTPPPKDALFPEKVLFVIVSVPVLLTPPPLEIALLPEKVLFVMVAVPNWL